MTRINCVPAKELTQAHLIAEYRELPRIRHAWPRKTKPVIPKNYLMGKGHVTFFYDKGIWLENRHAELIAEMLNRGYNANLPPLNLSHWPESAMNDWEATSEAIAVNKKRIAERQKG